jgi:hypothetical protein
MVRLQNFGTDTVDQLSSCDLGPGSQTIYYYAQIQVTNTGSTILTTHSVDAGITAVDASSTPHNVNHCDPQDGATAEPGCSNSTSSIDLSIGDTATVCPVFALLPGITLSEVQFDASQAFVDFGNGQSVAVWHLN